MLRGYPQLDITTHIADEAEDPKWALCHPLRGRCAPLHATSP